MKSNEIKRLVEKIRFRPSAAADERIIAYSEAALDKSTKTRSANFKPNIVRITMKNRITKCAAAAVIFMGIYFGLKLIGGPSTTGLAYGITDVPELLNSAKTLHIKGRRVYHLQGQEPVSCPFEYWIDFDKVRSRVKTLRRKSVNGRFTDDYQFSESVWKNEYIMSVNHTDKSIVFWKGTPFFHRLSLRRRKENDKFLRSFYLRDDQLEDFKLTGQEKNNGVIFDVWEKNNGTVTVKYWVSPSTGQLGRYCRQYLYDRYVDEKNIDKIKRHLFTLLDKKEHEWHEDIVNVIERDVEFPDEVFKLEQPGDYTVKTSKEDAESLGMRKYPMFNIQVPIVCVLNDGSVVVGWSYLDNDSGRSQENLFADLQPGGQLPKLTHEFYALHRNLLEPIPGKPNSNKIIGSIVYSGHHLAYTKKDNQYYEWSIYVPNSQPPKGKATYYVQTRNNHENTTTQAPLFADIVIKSAEDFDTFVRGAMVGFSDDAIAPKHVTYDYVFNLADEIRTTMGEKNEVDLKSEDNLKPSVSFRVKVVDSQSGKPVENVRLYQQQQPEIEGYSDNKGLIEFDSLLPAKTMFWVEAKGYARWWSAQCANKSQRFMIRNGWQRNFDYLTFNLKNGMEPVTIEVERGVLIRGKVLDPKGNLVAGATVAPALTGTGNSITGDTRFSVETLKDGSFEMLLPASKKREYNFVAHDGKFNQSRKWANGVTEPFRTKPGQEWADVEIWLTESGTVRGSVINRSGEPIIGRKVRAHAFDKLGSHYDPTTETDENGNFELKFIRPGKHYIQVAPFWLAAEEAPKETSQLIEVKAGEVIEDIELVGNPMNN